RERRPRDLPVPRRVGEADDASGAGGLGASYLALRHPPSLADDRAYADRHGALQAGHPQRRPFPGVLPGSGGHRVRRRRPVDLPRTLAGFRDEVGPPGLRASQRAIKVLGQLPGGSGLGSPRDAGLPAWLAAQPDGGRGTRGPHQLPAADGDLHHYLLRPWLRPLRVHRPGRTVPNRAGSMGIPVRGIVRVAPLLHHGAGGMGVALAYLRTTAESTSVVGFHRWGVRGSTPRPAPPG